MWQSVPALSGVRQTNIGAKKPAQEILVRNTVPVRLRMIWNSFGLTLREIFVSSGLIIKRRFCGVASVFVGLFGV